MRQPPEISRRRPRRETASKSTADGWSGGHDEHTRLVAVDPVTVRSLALVVPCALCTDGLCWRCWTVARAVEQLTIAGRRDQAPDAWEVAA